MEGRALTRTSPIAAGLLAVLACVALAACEDVRRWGGRGVVEDVKPDQGLVLIDHDPIPGLMDAMTMNFEVADPALFDTLKAGQEISFTLVKTSRAYEIVDVRVLGTVEIGDEWARLGEELVRTTEAPPFELIDQDGETVSSEALRGRVLLVDFVFTRCPGPCPIETRRQVRVQRLVPDALRDRVHFVSISLDPVNDTPAALRAYGESHGASFANWSFLGGAPETVDTVVRAHHVGKTRDENGVIEHLNVVFLVDPRGRILRRYMGMSDDAETIAGDLVAAARAAEGTRAGEGSSGAEG